MSQSVIIVDPKTEISAKQGINTLVLQPSPSKSEPSKLRDIAIEQVRQAIPWVSQTSFDGQPRFLIIQPQEFNIGQEAQQALLKTIEEPPADLTVIILTQRLADLLPTIQSRCATYSLTNLPAESTAWPLELVNQKPARVSKSTFIDWADFLQQPANQQLDTLGQILKAKKSPADLIEHWISQIVKQPTTPQSLHQLDLLHQAQRQLSAHVTPRLVFNQLHIHLLLEINSV